MITLVPSIYRNDIWHSVSGVVYKFRFYGHYGCSFCSGKTYYPKYNMSRSSNKNFIARDPYVNYHTIMLEEEC